MAKFQFQQKQTKKRFSEHEEFEIMKIVLDKFLWLGTALMGYGLYLSIASTFTEGVWYITAGAVVMLLFSWVVLREFELTR